MKKPKIAIVGRPNVGKSSLFNRIVKKRIAIVDEMEGVTRDRLYAEGDFFGQPFLVIDTGGIDCDEEIPFWREVKGQVDLALDEADILMMVVDSRVGITAPDKEIARYLHSKKKPLLLAVNKIDNQNDEAMIHEFHQLGIETMVGVSAAQGSYIAELLERALELSEGREIEEEDDAISVAILGRPNVGKSTFLNTLLNEERSIVSPIAGTTRDIIDGYVEIEGTRYRLLDTAGLRRKSKEPEVVDKFSRIRTERALKRADVVIFMIDAREGVTSQEKKLLTEIEKMGKGCLLFFNKWDLVKGFRMEHCAQRARDILPFLNHCPMLFGSSLTGRGVEEAFTSVNKVYQELTRRVTTGQLNKFLERSLQINPPPMINGKRLRIYYMTQVTVHPPRFVLFVNYPDRMTRTYQKYLINQFRAHYGFKGVPLSFSLRKKKSTRKLGEGASPQLDPIQSIGELVFSDSLV